MQYILKALVMLLSAILFACSSKKSDEGFSPSPHPVTIDKSLYEVSSVRDGYTKFDREAIREKITSDSRYEKPVENTKKSVSQLIAMSDDELRSLIPPAHTIRALMVHRKGCPIHGGGTSVYQPFGTRVDISLPLQVKCPIGGEVYPNKDFPDDGSGWLDNRPDSPTRGERYYFVGWFNMWFLGSLSGHIHNMALTWFITDEEIYNHKARVLLERFMEVYPDMNGNDLTYDGTDWGVYVKMLPTMWEGSALMRFAKSVELLLPSLDDDFLENVRDKIYRPAFEAYREKPAPSNWGNVWNAPFAKFANVTGDTEILDFMISEHCVAAAPTLDNQFFRDGFPYEAGYSYCSHYMSDSRSIAEELGKNGDWIWQHPKMRESFHAFANLMCLDKFTHYFGDGGSIYNRGLHLSDSILTEAFRKYRTPELARYLLQAGGPPEKSISLAGLFEKEQEEIDIEEVRHIAAQAEPMKSTLSPVRGFAVMRTGTGDERTALFFDYGYAHTAHSHADRLNINIFALDREFICEMGYPEYMDSVQPSPGGWTTHTVSHATVEVNQKRQLEGTFGDLHAFVHADGIKYVDASCEDAYVHCDVNLYRRSLALIDVPGGAYVVDIFRVSGGNMHDYLFHGPPVDVENAPPFKKPYGGRLQLEKVNLSKPREGTLLGENIPFGQKPEGVLPYHVDNPGYQYLYDVRECEKDSPYRARWITKEGEKFSATFIPGDKETFMLTTGYPRPSSKSLPPMPFLVRRHIPDGKDDISLFASVLSYYHDKPLVLEARKLELTPESDPAAFAIFVKHTYGEDVVLSTLSPEGYAKTQDGRFELKGQLGAAAWRDGALARLTLIGGSDFTVYGKSTHLENARVTATVKKVFDNSLILDKPFPATASGNILFAERAPVKSSYRVDSVEGTKINVSPSSWIGKARVGSYDKNTGVVHDGRNIFPLGAKKNRLADITGMKFPEGDRNYYAGSWMVSEDGSSYYRLTKGSNAGFHLDKNQNLSHFNRDFPQGKEFLIYDLGPGDTVWVLNYKQVIL